MKVYLNEKAVEVSDDKTLEGLLTACNIDVKGIAVAVNNRVVPRAQWGDTVLERDAKVMVIRATCGG